MLDISDTYQSVVNRFPMYLLSASLQFPLLHNKRVSELRDVKGISLASECLNLHFVFPVSLHVWLSQLYTYCNYHHLIISISLS